MRTLGFGGFALSASLASLWFAGCGGSQSPIGAPGATTLSLAPSPARAAARRVVPLSFEVVHRFGWARAASPRGGANPDAGLIDVNGTLYGTTNNGGPDRLSGCVSQTGCGIVYSISASGAKKVLYYFRGGYGDGLGPAFDLTNMNGTLFGTTYFGGTCLAGTVYSVSATGTEKELHSFCDGNPSSGVINVNGTLYGTNVSEVYSISSSGVYKVVYTLSSGPNGQLLNVNGTLYGVTLYGGGGGSGGSYCTCGSVYSLTTSGKETLLYGFKGGSDGWFPFAGLINVNGTLYGTTYYGGHTGCQNNWGCGIVYSISTSGAENVLYRFTGGADGGHPAASLLDVNGTLYGTTFAGGAYGLGIVFSISTSGSEQVLHSFGGPDGAGPRADLIDVNGTLYGTTYYGGFPWGCGGKGCGTVFALTP